jgi:hypothetical protein
MHLFHVGGSRASAARMTAAACTAIAAAGALAGAALAAPTTYFAAPDATSTSGCTAGAPCRLDAAVAAASAGDTVFVLPGDYTVGSTLASSLPITLEGQAGQPRPSLTAAKGLTGAAVSLTGGALISHLDIHTHVSGQAPLSLQGGTAQDLILQAKGMGSSALIALDAAAGTTVRTVLAVALPGSGPAVRLADGSAPGTVTLDNVTAVALGPVGTALSDGILTGAATVKNTIASGPTADITADSGARPIQATHSALRPGFSTGYIDMGANVASAPVFAGDESFHEAPSSPTIDAASPDPGQTAADLDGNAWSAGIGPDIGAYEYVAGQNGQPGVNGQPGSQSPLVPVPGVSVTVRPAGGVLRIKIPRTHTFVALTGAAQLPVGTIIDARRGTVSLTSAVDTKGATKTGRFTGASFIVQQSRGAHPLTALALTGGSFAACTQTRTVAHTMKVTARMARPIPGNPRRVVRQLWGHDNGGRFTTIGRSASATVRGTVWLTQDRCDGTLIRVLRGHVVVYDRKHHRHVVIGPGHSYLARA